MKKYEAFNREENNHLIEDGEVMATEATYLIIAADESRALQLIEDEGDESGKYYLEETTAPRDQNRNYFPESIENCQL